MKYEHLFILPCCSEMLGENSTYSTVSLQDRLKKLKSEHGKVQLGNINVDMVLGGMRGMIGMLWETSLLDPEEVISRSSTS